MIRYDFDDDSGVATVTLDRPAKKNALTMDGLVALRAAFDRADEEAAVVVLRGAGDAFCTGEDVAIVAELGASVPAVRFGSLVYDVLFGVEALGVPVVAAVDGPAYGGGFELVGAADVAVATTDATFALPATTIGAFPPYAATRIAELGGRKRLLELILTGDPIDADTAREWGLVNRVVEPEAFDDAVDAMADRVTGPPTAVRMAKAYVRAATAGAYERERLVDGIARLADGEDGGDAARAFLDR